MNIFLFFLVNFVQNFIFNNFMFIFFNLKDLSGLELVESAEPFNYLKVHFK